MLKIGDEFINVLKEELIDSFGIKEIWKNDNGVNILSATAGADIEVNGLPNLTPYKGYKISLWVAYANDGIIELPFMILGNRDQVYLQYLRNYAGGSNNDILIFQFMVHDFNSTKWKFRAITNKAIQNSNVIVNTNLALLRLYKITIQKVGK